MTTKLRCRFKAMPNRYSISPGFIYLIKVIYGMELREEMVMNKNYLTN